MQKHNSNPWEAFETELNDLLSTIAQQCNLIYKEKKQDIYEKCPQGFKSDGLITDGKVLIALEIERTQKHPDTNVGKYWYVYEKCHKYDKIVLIHIYTPVFESYPWRVELGRFYADKMKEYGVPLEYIVMDYRGKQNDPDTALNEVAEILKKYVNQYMNCKV